MARQHKGRPESAQATVEFALVLPLLVAVMWLGVESVLLGRDQTLVTHAAREAARAAAVGASYADVRGAAVSRSGLGDNAAVMDVSLNSAGGVAEVTVSLREASRLPLIGRLLPSLKISSTVAMRIESEV